MTTVATSLRAEMSKHWCSYLRPSSLSSYLVTAFARLYLYACLSDISQDNIHKGLGFPEWKVLCKLKCLPPGKRYPPLRTPPGSNSSHLHRVCSSERISMYIVSCNPPDNMVENTPGTLWLQESSRPAATRQVCLCTWCTASFSQLSLCSSIASSPRWFRLREESD